jgi:hypothetical protein
MLTLPVEAVSGALAVAVESPYVHEAPACVTVAVRPAIVIVPVRGLVEVFPAAAYVTVPLPLPLAPAVMVSHDAFDVADQEHPLVAVTAMLLVEAPAAIVAFAGEKVIVQGGGACARENVWPAIVSVAVRLELPVLVATAYATVPDPVPGAPLVIVSHDALLDALHAHADGIATLTLPLVDPDATDALVGDNVVAHVLENSN